MLPPNESHPHLVSPDWLKSNLGAPDLRIVDASWYLPDQNRNARQEFQARHIPGAVHFDIDEFSDHGNPLPHMLPDSVRFSSRARKLGLGDGNRIVVYDGAGLFSAARAWWMFRVMGHREVMVLDGGLPGWIARDYPVEDMPVTPVARHFTARLHSMLVRTLDQMIANLESRKEQVVDARAADRFHGRAPEPRPGLRSGHIPGSLNVPYTELLTEGGHMKDPDALRAVFDQAGVSMARPVVTTCGSGVTAAVVALALAHLGHRQISVYDGAWAEWGARSDLPIAP